GDPGPAAAGHGQPGRRVAAVRLVAVRGLLRGVSGRHRHPRGAGASAGAGGGGRNGDAGGQQGGAAAREGARRRAGRDARRALGVHASRCPAGRPAPRLAHPAAASAHPAGPRPGVERDPGPAAGAGGAVPGLVEAYAGREGRCRVSSRERILGRVRRALADVPGDDTPYERAVARDYLREHGERTAAQTADLLAENLADYRALVHRTDAAGLAGVVAGLLAARGASTVLVPPGLDAAWLASAEVTRVADLAESTPHE